MHDGLYHTTIHIIESILGIITQVGIPVSIARFSKNNNKSTRIELIIFLGLLILRRFITEDLKYTTRTYLYEKLYKQAIVYQYNNYDYVHPSKNLFSKDIENIHNGISNIIIAGKLLIVFVFVNTIRVIIFRKNGRLFVLFYFCLIILLFVHITATYQVLCNPMNKFFDKEKQFVMEMQTFLETTAHTRTYKLVRKNIDLCSSDYSKTVRYTNTMFNCGVFIIFIIIILLLTSSLKKVKDSTIRIALVLSLLDAIKDFLALVPQSNSIVKFSQMILSSVPYDFFQKQTVPIDQPTTPYNTDIIIKINSLTFKYPNQNSPILENFSCEIQTGARVIITGSNGRGKSTLMKLIAHKLDHRRSISLFGHTYISELDTGLLIGYYDSNMYLPPNSILNTFQYINHHLSHDEIISRLLSWNVMDLICVGNISLQSTYPDSLSVGQAQFVILLTILMNKNKLFLLDEPVANLHSQYKNAILRIVQSHLPSSTFVFISHDTDVETICTQNLIL